MICMEAFDNDNDTVNCIVEEILMCVSVHYKQCVLLTAKSLKYSPNSTGRASHTLYIFVYYAGGRKCMHTCNTNVRKDTARHIQKAIANSICTYSYISVAIDYVMGIPDMSLLICNTIMSMQHLNF